MIDKIAIKAQAARLKGSMKRAYMARVVQGLGWGGQRWAERELGWSRHTIRKGLRELNGEQMPVDNFSARGRRPVEEHLPNFMQDIEEIVRQCADRPLTSADVYEALLRRGYSRTELPTRRTINTKLKQLGCR